MKKGVVVVMCVMVMLSLLAANPAAAAEVSTSAPDCDVEAYGQEVVPAADFPPITVHRQLNFGARIVCHALFTTFTGPDDEVRVQASGRFISGPACPVGKEEVQQTNTTIWEADCSWSDSPDQDYYQVFAQLRYAQFGMTLEQSQYLYFDGNAEDGSPMKPIVCKVAPFGQQLAVEEEVANVESSRWIRYGGIGACGTDAGNAISIEASLYRLVGGNPPSWETVDSCTNSSTLTMLVDASCTKEVFDIADGTYLVTSLFTFRTPTGSTWWVRNYKRFVVL